MRKYFSILFLITFFVAGCKNKQGVNGHISNSQISINLVGSHSYPTIYFYGQINNTSSSPLKINYENRALSSSQFEQFYWTVDNDTLQLLNYHPDNPLDDEAATILPDSGISIALRPPLLHFFEGDKNQLSDSTYYKKVLEKYSEKGTIYFIDRNNNWVPLKRKNTYKTLQGVPELQ